ncbi:MAG: prepilin-type N-terminal cleavage/methylation domain-containing protein [Phycisphaerales bacterium]|nr:prepilin-type N-terminal cleavage/methylation domain-containing protein [Phycisphaerales bacterium]
MKTRPIPHTTRRTARAFTLLEVIVAVTIVAILAAVLAPRVGRFIGQAKDKRARAEAASMANQVRAYMVEAGLSKIPDDFDLEVLTAGDNPYLEKKSDLLDPWGNAYMIIVPGVTNFDFDILSYGADGQPGGEGDAGDITHGEQ